MNKTMNKSTENNSDPEYNFCKSELNEMLKKDREAELVQNEMFKYIARRDSCSDFLDDLFYIMVCANIIFSVLYVCDLIKSDTFVFLVNIAGAALTFFYYRIESLRKSYLDNVFAQIFLFRVMLMKRALAAEKLKAHSDSLEKRLKSVSESAK